MGKQREANRVIAQHLDAIQHEMEEMNKILKSANKMHGDLNRAAQWFVDRDTQASQKALSQRARESFRSDRREIRAGKNKAAGRYSRPRA